MGPNWLKESVNKPQRRVYLPKNWELPAAIMNRLGPEPGRQRLMDEEGHLLLILHQVPQAADDEVRTAALFWRQPDGTWKSTPQPGGLSALEEHLKAYREKIHDLDTAVESAASPGDYFAVMQEVQPVLRATRHLLDVLQGARQARNEEAGLIGYRDSAAELERGNRPRLGRRQGRNGFRPGKSGPRAIRGCASGKYRSQSLEPAGGLLFSTRDSGLIFLNGESGRSATERGELARGSRGNPHWHHRPGDGQTRDKKTGSVMGGAPAKNEIDCSSQSSQS